MPNPKKRGNAGEARRPKFSKSKTTSGEQKEHHNVLYAFYATKKALKDTFRLIILKSMSLVSVYFQLPPTPELPDVPQAPAGRAVWTPLVGWPAVAARFVAEQVGSSRLALFNGHLSALLQRKNTQIMILLNVESKYSNRFCSFWANPWQHILHYRNIMVYVVLFYF